MHPYRIHDAGGRRGEDALLQALFERQLALLQIEHTRLRFDQVAGVVRIAAGRHLAQTQLHIGQLLSRLLAQRLVLELLLFLFRHLTSRVQHPHRSDEVLLHQACVGGLLLPQVLQ